jgi:hypothetical protein
MAARIVEDEILCSLHHLPLQDFPQPCGRAVFKSRRKDVKQEPCWIDVFVFHACREQIQMVKPTFFNFLRVWFK